MSEFDFSTYEFAAREEELRRRNERLEAKKAEVIRRAEEVKRQQEEQIARAQYVPPSPSSRDPRSYQGEDEGRTPAAPEEAVPGTAGAGGRIASSRGRPSSARSVAPSAAPADADADLEMESELLGPRMGPEAKIRWQAARLKVMQEEIQKLVAEIGEKDRSLNVLEGKLKAFDEDNKRLSRGLQAAEAAAEKQKKSSAEAIKKADVLDKQVATLAKELESLQKSRKQAEVEKRARDVRLNRALEEAEKYKSMVREQKETRKDGSDGLRQENARLVAENKKLTRQKNELLAAFKKQLKLIDILKRQKVHIEAAKVLSFTEEEFTKTLELSDKL
eukprot:TRINITY_DN11466_c0_g3_i3.p1 TRINITY_DN11466_c0_g3~~TRINITY_DN11466_c0_g3_i3.p1  ORF type:complete len:333 (+),score=61.90 TRINITY_DN11466_c0_g3_i3:77-1075(+)